MSKGEWTTISHTEIGDPEPYKLETHTFRRLGKKLPWEYCPKCGLIALRNPFTQWCIRMGCNHDRHPLYKSTMLRMTKQ